jgi:hypothetical protein
MKKYRVVGYEEYTRNTYNTYTNAVVAINKEKGYSFCEGFMGRYDLAVKREKEVIRRIKSSPDRMGNLSDWEIVICDIEEVQTKINKREKIDYDAF